MKHYTDSEIVTVIQEIGRLKKFEGRFNEAVEKWKKNKLNDKKLIEEIIEIWEELKN